MSKAFLPEDIIRLDENLMVYNGNKTKKYHTCYIEVSSSHQDYANARGSEHLITSNNRRAMQSKYVGGKRDCNNSS